MRYADAWRHCSNGPMLQAAGVFAAVPTGVFWGIVFIMIGIAIAVRHSMRRARRQEFMAKRREAKRDSGADQKS